MIVLLVILGTIATLIGIIIFGIRLTVESRRRESSDWKVGDFVALIDGSDLHKLLGWSDDGFFIEKEGSVSKIEWLKLKFNKSVIWRRNWEKCKAQMGTDPGFSPGLGKDSSTGVKVDGKPIEFLSETECEVYLKRALDDEDLSLIHI